MSSGSAVARVVRRRRLHLYGRMQIDLSRAACQVEAHLLMMDDGRNEGSVLDPRVLAPRASERSSRQRLRVAEVSGRTATPGVFFGCAAPRTLILAEAVSFRPSSCGMKVVQTSAYHDVVAAHADRLKFWVELDEKTEDGSPPRGAEDSPARDGDVWNDPSGIPGRGLTSTTLLVARHPRGGEKARSTDLARGARRMRSAAISSRTRATSACAQSPVLIEVQRNGRLLKKGPGLRGACHHRPPRRRVRARGRQSSGGRDHEDRGADPRGKTSKSSPHPHAQDPRDQRSLQMLRVRRSMEIRLAVRGVRRDPAISSRSSADTHDHFARVTEFSSILPRFHERPRGTSASAAR